MDHNNPETLTDPDGEPGLTADCEDSESFCPEKEQGRCSSCVVTEDLNTEGSWSQKSISRSLQRAETLLRSTFNPSLKWLFHGRGPVDVEEEGNFVVAHNLVSRSSARLLRLQQALLTVAPQWQTVGGAQMGSPQVCAKGLQAEGGVLLRSSPLLQGNYKALCRLLQQRSLLLFIHEYSRRAHLAAAYISRVRHLLEDQLKKAHLTCHQSPSSWSSFRVGLCSLSQELRVHLNHWSSLFSRVQSDPYLRPSLAQHSRLLVEIRQTLDLLGLQALVLMDRYVFVILSAVAQTELNSVPREVLEDILAGTDLYNQAVGEQRVQHRTTQLRTAVLQQAHHSTPASGLPNRKGHHPAAFSVKELMVILAVHHGGMAAKQLHCWVSEQSRHICQVHTKHKACTCCDSSVSQVGSCGSSTLRPEWTWEQLLHAYLTSPPLSSMNPHLHSSYCHSCHKTPPVNIPDLHLDSTVSEQHHPVSAQHRKAVDKGQTSQCQTHISLVSAQANLERQSSLENGKLLKTISPPSATPVRLSALPLSGLCRQDHSSVELLFQLLVSSSDLLAPLASHTPTPEAPHEQLCPNTLTDVLPPDGQTDPTTLTAPVPQAADSVELDRTSTDLNKDQSVTGAQQEWTKLEITVGPEATVSSSFQKDPEREGMGRAEVAAVRPDCLRWPHSVQWLDLGQSLVFADLFGQYRSLLWAVCSKALWLQLHVPQAGNTAGSLNLQDNHRRFQILHSISQASQTELVPKECRAMMEDFSLYLLAITAHAQWDSVVCRSLGSALTDKCLTEVNHSSHSVGTSSEQDAAVMMSVTMKHFLQLSPPLLSSLCCSQSKSWASGSFNFLPSRLTLQRHTVNLAVATVQLSTVWVISKAYQFLSSWSLNKFLLITQGDLKVLRESLELMVHQTKPFTPNSDSDHQVSLHNQFLQKQQLETLHSAVSQLQTLSSLMLKAFSSDCKRMSGEIFEQTMPSAVHWRPGLRTGFPSSPSEYASLAAQTVIGQVLEGVAPLSDDARGQALSITMTAFMEAWMEHILKQKIKFSVHGALQLKQDFDSIREMIQSEKYGLSAELHQRLLSLRVFQQVDSAVVCLLQQPQAKPYLQSRTWEPFTRCCPANSSRDSIDAVVGGSITNLRCVEGEDLTRSEPSFVTSDLPPVDPPSPGEPYLAPSVALGAAQQEWLDLRIHSSTRRWRLPGLQCLSKSEP